MTTKIYDIRGGTFNGLNFGDDAAPLEEQLASSQQQPATAAPPAQAPVSTPAAPRPAPAAEDIPLKDVPARLAAVSAAAAANPLSAEEGAKMLAGALSDRMLEHLKAEGDRWNTVQEIVAHGNRGMANLPNDDLLRLTSAMGLEPFVPGLKEKVAALPPKSMNEMFATEPAPAVAALAEPAAKAHGALADKVAETYVGNLRTLPSAWVQVRSFLHDGFTGFRQLDPKDLVIAAEVQGVSPQLVSELVRALDPQQQALAEDLRIARLASNTSTRVVRNEELSWARAVNTAHQRAAAHLGDTDLDDMSQISRPRARH